MTIELTRAQARRIAVRAQLLDAERPTDLLEVVEHLTFLQLEPTAAVAPSADLVLWSRLGSRYDRSTLQRARDELDLIEVDGLLRVPAYLALLRADMADWPGRGPLRPWQEQRLAWVEANGGARQDVLALLRSDGPLPTSALPDTTEAPWRSTGWTHDKNMSRLLGFMVGRGEVAVAGRDGQQRLWDLAERVYPDEEPVPAEEAERLRDDLRLRALGIARARSAQVPVEQTFVGQAGVEAVVEGVKGTWRVDPALLDGDFTGRTALLSPFDRLVSDRKRMGELFGFDYVLEMYKPVAERRWGYYALPVLHGDRLVGKVDATAEPDEGVLRVDAVHEDEPFAADVTAAVDAEIEDLATWLGLDVLRLDRAD